MASADTLTNVGIKKIFRFFFFYFSVEYYIEFAFNFIYTHFICIRNLFYRTEFTFCKYMCISDWKVYLYCVNKIFFCPQARVEAAK